MKLGILSLNLPLHRGALKCVLRAVCGEEPLCGKGTTWEVQPAGAQ